jgi:hypothetical protein
MKIVINSHNKNSVALQCLINSIIACNEYKNYEFIVVIGGYYTMDVDYGIKKDNIFTYIFCNHNSIDYTGLITLLDIYSDNVGEYYFYLHDTCMIGKDFFNKLNAIDLTNVSSVRILKVQSMNIGVYSQKVINEFREFLLSRKNTDESKCMAFKNSAEGEDYIFNNDANNFTLAADGYYAFEPSDFYNTGTMRRVEWYTNIDLYKIKANWGQGTPLTLNL